MVCSKLDHPKFSSSISAIPIMGVIESDNIAMQLTHHLHVSSKFHFGPINSLDSITGKGSGLSVNGRRVLIDIGQNSIFDQLPGVGGILGIDVVMKCSAIRYIQVTTTITVNTNNTTRSKIGS
jgi:hypothetical protein